MKIEKKICGEKFLLLLEGYNIIIKRNLIFSIFENGKQYESKRIIVGLKKY